MKYIVRIFLFHVFALWLTSNIFPGMALTGNWQTILIAGFILSILMLIIKPILHILFIPINLITFGLLSWTINVIVLFLLTVILPDVQIIPWVSPKIDWQGFIIPSFHITYIMSLIIASLTVTACTNILHFVSET